MRSIFASLTLVFVLGLAVWTYAENYRTNQVLDELQQLNRDMAVAKSRLRVLNAEWAYLNRPERLAELATLNFDQLKLLNLRPEHFLRIDQIPFPEQNYLETAEDSQ